MTKVLEITITVIHPAFREPGYVVYDNYPHSQSLSLYTTVRWDRGGEPFDEWDFDGDRWRMQTDVLARKAFYEKKGHTVMIKDVVQP